MYNLGCVTVQRAIVWYGQGRLEEVGSEVLRAAEIFEKLGAARDLKRCGRIVQGIQKVLGRQIASGQSGFSCEFLQMVRFPAVLTFHSKLREPNDRESLMPRPFTLLSPAFFKIVAFFLFTNFPSVHFFHSRLPFHVRRLPARRQQSASCIKRPSVSLVIFLLWYLADCQGHYGLVWGYCGFPQSRLHTLTIPCKQGKP